MGDSTGPGPQDPSEPTQGRPEPAHQRPDTTGRNGTTPSDPPWLFQKGNTCGKLRKRHRLEKYIQKQTTSGSVIVEFFLTLASGRPFPMKCVVHLPLSPEQYAVARGLATPEQRRIATKQRRFIVITLP